MMTKEEWISRCAARYVERGGLSADAARAAAVACCEAESGEAEFSTIADYEPEACADEDMSHQGVGIVHQWVPSNVAVSSGARRDSENTDGRCSPSAGP